MKIKNDLSTNKGAQVATALWTRRQVANRLNCHTETVKRYDHAGILTAIRLNSRVVRYDPTDVERFISQARNIQAAA